MGYIGAKALVVGILFSVGPVDAQVYRCDDSSGNATYTDTACDESSSATQGEIDSSISVIDRSGARQLEQQRSHQGTSQGSASVGRQGGAYQQQAQSILAEAQRVSEVASKIKNSSINSRERAYAMHLINSARILEASTKTSSQGLAAIRESNRVALNAAKLTSVPTRSSMIRKADVLQKTAAIQLGSPVNFASSSPSQPSSTNLTPSSPNIPAPPIPVPPQPTVITSCDDGGCWDSRGNRYNSGGGSTHFPTTGGSCQLIGGMMRCP